MGDPSLMSDSAAILTDDNEQSLQALGKFLLDEKSEELSFAPTTSPEPENTFFQAEPVKMLNDASLKGESVQQRVQRVSASANPLLEASQPLLRALSEMPAVVTDNKQVELLKRTLTSEINVFTVICEEINIPWKKMTIVRYCLCTALDEAAHATSWGVTAGWARSNLLNHFEGDNDGGNKFFLLAGRLSMHPHEYIDVLDIMLRILELGFEGRYSIIEDGDRQLMKIRQSLLTLLQNTSGKVEAELSPHGLPSRSEEHRRSRLHIPVRGTLLLAVILTVGTFIFYKYPLLMTEQKLTNRIDALTRLVPSEIVKPQRLRLAILLKNEIAQKLVSVDENDSRSKVVFNGDSMFASASVNVRPEMVQILKRVATELRRVNGDVLIIGHTDSTPIHKPNIANNQVLSEQRAANVAQLLINAQIPEKKIRVEGMGERQPLQSNQDAAGRAKNRRVEMFITY
ncbi:type VI secretion system protein TssL [Serratia sp. S1B]|nr:type VI secretion system protein TssL [Serratia sp. S1B]